MALQSNRVQVIFRGLETRLDPRQAMLGDLIELRNVAFDNPPRINKRPGTKRLTTFDAVREYEAQGIQGLLANYKDELVAMSNKSIIGYRPDGSISSASKGSPPNSLGVTVESIHRELRHTSSPDVAVHPFGVTLFTYEATQGDGSVKGFYGIMSTASRQAVLLDVLVGVAGLRPKPIVLGNWIVIFYYESSGAGTGHIRYIAVNPIDMTASAPVDLATNVYTTPPSGPVFDVSRVGDDAYLIYATSGSKIGIVSLTSKLVAGTPVDLITPANPPAVAMSVIQGSSGGSHLWVVWADSLHTAKAAAYDSSLGQVGSTVTLDAVSATLSVTGADLSNGLVCFAWSANAYGSGVPSTYTATWDLNTGSFISGPNVWAHRVALASKMWIGPFSGAYVLAAHESPLQSTFFLLGPWQQRAYARLAYGTGKGKPEKSCLPEVIQSNGKVSTVYLEAGNLMESSTIGLASQVGIQMVTFDYTAPTYTVEAGGNLFVSGGLLSMYDGANMCEHGFNLFPEGMTATPSGSGTVSDKYWILAVYEWMDNAGLVHQSSRVPFPSLIDFNSNADVSYEIPTLPLTSKATPVSIVIYRALEIPGVFYRVSSIALPTLNDTSVSSITVNESAISGTGAFLTDAQLQARDIYLFNPFNTNAEIDPQPLSAVSFITRYRNRVIAIPAENPMQWQFSKSMQPNTPVEFNPGIFFQPIMQGPGPLTCAIEMDDKLILFAKDRIFWMTGDGPAPNGLNSDYGNAYRIPADCGCDNPRSLVLVPEGVMFQSDKGIQLLKRDLTLQYIGAPVERFNYARVTSAVMAPKSRRVAFGTDQGIALVYDYYVGRWAVWENFNVQSFTAFDGLLTFIKPNGWIMQETPGVFNDEGEPINIGLVTSWIQFAQLGGFQRVWRFIIQGDYHSPHKLLASVGFDDRPAKQNAMVDTMSIIQPGVVGDTVLADTENPGDGMDWSYEWQVKVLQQKSTSIQIELREAQKPPYGEGLAISGLAFIVGIEPSLHKVPAVRSPKG